MALSVVVPVYNGAATLPELITRLRDVLPSTCGEYELILVNDGSRDASWQTILELAGNFPEVRAFNLMRNYGQHNAILCGIRAARHDVVVTLDDDLQHPPEEIPKLLDKLAEGFDVVYGTPAKEEHDFWRMVASRITKLALRTAMGAETALQVSAFRAFRTPIRDAFEQYRGTFVCIDVLLTWGTSRFTSIRVNHLPRPAGASNYTVRKLIRHAMNMVTGFSVVPLQLASLIGFSLTLFGLILLAYVIGRYLIQGVTVPGFAFLASVVIIFSGAQLFALGIIGEYLARIHFRVMDRPPYVVRELQSGPAVSLDETVRERV
ncbi:MAG TPA: glycosyltransferase family 2 protein [Bryobacteraceae bacterium]|nr:glycosyltransferase family 2 protein [Bryobacteraceae bacterium]